MPESAALRVGNLMLGVRELARSVAFYRDALGLSVRFASQEFVFLDVGGLAIVLHHIPDLRETSDERRIEIVFHVDDIDAAHRTLRNRGVAFRIEPRIVTGDQLAADFRDPDGHVLSIFGPRRAGSAPEGKP
jgi:catechol 2,3-dioxygenase-like lactoylglutathione lyase family enzyme